MTAETKLSPKLTFALLGVTLGAIALVFILVFLPSRNDPGVVEETTTLDETTAKQTINQGQIFDAIKDPAQQAREGFRYRVKIADMSREGTAGIARIGGLITFIDGVTVGDIAVIEVTRVKQRVAEAMLVTIEGHDDTVTSKPSRAPGKAPVFSGEESFTGVVEDVGKRGDGIIRKDGLVIFIPGVAKGDYIKYGIISERENHAQGALIEQLDKSGMKPAEQAKVKHTESPVQVGEDYEIVVTEKDRKFPDEDGVVRIEGLVVFVPDTQPGDKVKIRIEEVGPSFARSSVLERFGKAEIPAARPRKPRVDTADMKVQPGEEYDVEISDKSRRNPDTEGIARIDGLVVFVPDTQPGDKVRIKITERRARSAQGMIISGGSTEAAPVVEETPVAEAPAPVEAAVEAPVVPTAE